MKALGNLYRNDEIGDERTFTVRNDFRLKTRKNSNYFVTVARQKSVLLAVDLHLLYIAPRNYRTLPNFK